MRFFLLSIILFGTIRAEAQTLELNNNFVKSETFPVSYYIDSSRNLGFEEVISRKFEKAVSRQNFGFVRYPMWVRIELGKNTTDKPYLLEIRLADSLTVWQKDKQGQWTSILTGDVLPFSSRPIAHHSYLFPLNLSPDQASIVYLCYKKKTQTRLKIRIWDMQEFYKEDKIDHLFYGLFYGIMVLMIVYNIFVWVAVRDVAYLYYIGFAFFMLLFQSTRHTYQYIWGNMPFFYGSGIYWWVGGSNFCAAQFGRLFLNTHYYAPKVGKWLKYASFYGILIAILATFLDYSAISRIVLTINPFYSNIRGDSLAQRQSLCTFLRICLACLPHRCPCAHPI